MQVRVEVQEALRKIIMAKGEKRRLNELSRMWVLEETPLLRAHLWKCTIANNEVMLETLDGPSESWEQTRRNNLSLYQALRDKFLPSYVDEEDLLDISGNTVDRELWD